VKDTDDKIMQRKIKFFILSILAGALIFCGSGDWRGIPLHRLEWESELMFECSNVGMRV
jgi:hypothetical protein